MAHFELKKKLKALYAEQISSWELLKENVSELDLVKRKSFTVNGDDVVVQYNPKRAASTFAKIDAASIAARPCFLCPQNLLKDQNGFIVEEDYLVLCNPRPIFREHFTVSSREHLPQDLEGREGEFVKITKELGVEYALLFNGARAGASAPDHLHFQICPAAELPLLRSLNIEVEQEGAFVKEFYGVNFLLFATKSAEESKKILKKVLAQVADRTLLNVIATTKNDTLITIVIIRAAHRPSCYTCDDEERRVLVSPAAVEMGGVFVVAREKDFERLNEGNVAEIFKEVVDQDLTSLYP